MDFISLKNRQVNISRKYLRVLQLTLNVLFDRVSGMEQRKKRIVSTSRRALDWLVVSSPGSKPGMLDVKVMIFNFSALAITHSMMSVQILVRSAFKCFASAISGFIEQNLALCLPNQAHLLSCSEINKRFAFKSDSHARQKVHQRGLFFDN